MYNRAPQCPQAFCVPGFNWPHFAHRTSLRDGRRPDASLGSGMKNVVDSDQLGVAPPADPGVGGSGGAAAD